MSDAQHSEYSHLTMIGLILLWLGRYFAWGETRAWIDDYFGYYEGTGYKKMSFAEPGKFVNCAGTIEQLRDQVGSLLNGMNPIRGLLRRGIAMEPAYEILEMLVMNLIAEWRTYFYQNGYDPIRMPNNEMNRLADLSYNRWRFFLASVQQLKRGSTENSQ
uniref:DUF4760 domain-containing protein n=1 Tax=Caenorhabditis tropicalis TaxID=1561998 RepID=A0A1I7TQ19_9PELO